MQRPCTSCSMVQGSGFYLNCREGSTEGTLLIEFPGWVPPNARPLLSTSATKIELTQSSCSEKIKSTVFFTLQQVLHKRSFNRSRKGGELSLRHSGGGAVPLGAQNGEDREREGGGCAGGGEGGGCHGIVTLADNLGVVQDEGLGLQGSS